MELNMSIHSKSALETFCVIVPTFFLTFIAINLAGAGFKRNRWMQNFIFEICIVVLPLLAILTILVDYVVLVNLVLITFCAFVVLFNWNCSDGGLDDAEIEALLLVGKKTFITNTRSSVNMLTAIAILAVDFNVFPTRFHKTHKYGFSLMDVGVGAYVFANGIVAPEIRGKRYSLWKSFTSVAPLLVIGIGRFVMTSLTNYQVNVTEYGVHWNFFITLAITRLISAGILSVTKCSTWNCILEGIAILSFHQLLLERGLEDYVFSKADRDNFFSANREGIVSTVGYIGMYFLSVGFGCLVNSKNHLTQLLQLMGVTAALGISTYILYNFFNISRCLANSTYCVWILFLSMALLVMFYIAEEFCTHFYSKKMWCAPFIFEAINYNGLLFFIVANLLTGLINIVFTTRKVANMYSMIILAVYLIATCLIVSLLYVKGIKLKL